MSVCPPFARPKEPLGRTSSYLCRRRCRVFGGPGDPDLADLLTAADALDTAIATGVNLAQAVANWRAATDALRDRLVAYLLGKIPVPSLPLLDPTDGWDAPDGVRLDASFGPLGLHVEGPSLRLPDPGNPAAPQLIIGPLPPNAVTAHLEAGPVIGDGSITMLDDGVNGALSLHLGAIEVAALASLRRVQSQPSFAAVFAAGFTPGIQFGFGFQLSRIGGVVGINRTVDVDALAAKLRDGSAGEALFPLDIGSAAQRALAALEAILVPRVGNSVAGPTLRLSWLEIAGQGFCSLDIGVLVELPGPQRIVIVGIARAGIPPVLKLRVDVVGVIDFTRQLALGRRQPHRQRTARHLQRLRGSRLPTVVGQPRIHRPVRSVASTRDSAPNRRTSHRCAGSASTSTSPSPASTCVPRATSP